MKIFSIYKATNKVNGKIYIGFDSNWPKRKQDHKREHKNNKFIFHRAIKKYGWDCFEWEVICQSLDGKYLLNKIEPHFIEYYDSYHNGYNMTKGGEGHLGCITSEETKRKQSLAFTLERRINQSRIMKIRATTHPGCLKRYERMKTDNPGNYEGKIMPSALGLKRSVATKEKLSQSKLGQKNHNYLNKEASFHLNNEKYQCNVCNIFTNLGNLNRWHNDKCKPRLYKKRTKQDYNSTII